MEKSEFKLGQTVVQLIKGDITTVDADAIVNAANSSLLGGGGVDGAIHHKGGPAIMEECKAIRQTIWPEGLPTGKAVITSGGKLKAKYVIHTVGPVWHGGKRKEAELLREAYMNSLQLAASKGLRTIAFPSISTGAYGYPVEKASRVALETVKDFIEKEATLDKVVFVLFSDEIFKVYQQTAEKLF
ncbi:MAG: O-acetyl-ADP-ribose deacetylase [Candidatus Bathyarchaeia archaeon]